MTRRDMTKAQFKAACERHGFIKQLGMGYYKLPCGWEVSIWNCGPTRREQLAYFIKENEELPERTKHHAIKRGSS